MCLPSGEYATEFTQFECPVSVHSCSWTKHGVRTVNAAANDRAITN